MLALLKPSSPVTPGQKRTRMISELTVKNFKCFREMHLSNLGAVNVVVGDNGAGKTSFLESLYLSQSGRPEIVLRCRVWRGLGREMAVDSTRETYESLWKNLFFGMDQSLTIEVETSGSPEQSRKAKLFYSEKSLVETSPRQVDHNSKIVLNRPDETSFVPITFEYYHNHSNGGFDNPVTMQPRFHDGTLMSGQTPPSLVAMYASSFVTVVPPNESAKQFSLLSKQKKQSYFEKEMRKLYPFIRGFSIEEEVGGTMLFADVKHLKEKIPIGMVSSGMQKLCMLLLGMTSQAGGIVLIDEIENGFYFEKLPEVWKAIHAFSKKFNTQVFASTHSKECLQALAGSLKQHAKDFRLIRIEGAATASKARIFKGEELEAAIRTGTEFR